MPTGRNRWRCAGASARLAEPCECPDRQRLAPAGALVGAVVAGAAVLPVAADPGFRPGEASFVEQVAADALHGGGRARGPDPSSGGEVGGRFDDGGDEGIARGRTGGEVVPLDVRRPGGVGAGGGRAGG